MPIDEDLDDYFKQIEKEKPQGKMDEVDEDNLLSAEELLRLFEEEPPQHASDQPIIDLKPQTTGTVILKAGDVPRLDATGEVYTNRRVYDPTQANLFVCYVDKDRLEKPTYAMLEAGLKRAFGKHVGIEGSIFLATEEVKPQHPNKQMGVIVELQKTNPGDAGGTLLQPAYALRPLSRKSLRDYIVQAEEATVTVAGEPYFTRVILLAGPIAQLTLLTSMVNSVLQQEKKNGSYFLQE